QRQSRGQGRRGDREVPQEGEVVRKSNGIPAGIMRRWVRADPPLSIASRIQLTEMVASGHPANATSLPSISRGLILAGAALAVISGALLWAKADPAALGIPV